MLGAIIGDIAGSRWEFNPTNDYDFELFSDKNGFTDDTVCTIAIADALLHGSDDYGTYLHQWCRRYPHPKGDYGGRFAQWVISNHPEPYGSFGNGSAMRVSPIGWWFNDRNELMEQAKKTAECTHNHVEGIKGAQTIALAIHFARIMRRQFSKTIDKEQLKQLIDNIFLYTVYNTDIEISAVQNRFDETCQGTVPVALWIIGNSNCFEDAIRRAVSLGADADTLGCIVGSIAEALWGIPEWMKQKALSYLPAEMRAVVSKFHNHTKGKNFYAAVIYGVEYLDPEQENWQEEAIPALTLTEAQYKVFVKGYAPDWECRYTPYPYKGWLYITRSGFWLKKFRFNKQADGLYHLAEHYTTEKEAHRDLLQEVLIEGYFKPSLLEVGVARTQASNR